MISQNGKKTPFLDLMTLSLKKKLTLKKPDQEIILSVINAYLFTE